MVQKWLRVVGVVQKCMHRAGGSVVQKWMRRVGDGTKVAESGWSATKVYA